MKKHLVKNILLEIFFILTAVIAWAAVISLVWENPTTLPTFIISVLFIGAVLVYAFFTDKWWNIPGIIYTALLLFLTLNHWTANHFFILSSSYLYLELVIVPPVLGMDYIFDSNASYCLTVTIFCVSAIGIMVSKYLRKEKNRHEKNC